MTALDERPTSPPAEIGRDRRRKEDQRLITGRTRLDHNRFSPRFADVQASAGVFFFVMSCC